jgi:hypothetical protein
MTSPRKFAEKIALIQQKQAEGDAAFNTILYEVEAAKQVYKKNNLIIKLFLIFNREPIVFHQQRVN